jgi:hypothetical protein
VDTLGVILKLRVAVAAGAIDSLDRPGVREIGGAEPFMTADAFQFGMRGPAKHRGINVEGDRFPPFRHRQPLLAMTSQACTLVLGGDGRCRQEPRSREEQNGTDEVQAKRVQHWKDHILCSMTELTVLGLQERVNQHANGAGPDLLKNTTFVNPAPGEFSILEESGGFCFQPWE